MAKMFAGTRFRVVVGCLRWGKVGCAATLIVCASASVVLAQGGQGYQGQPMSDAELRMRIELLKQSMGFGGIFNPLIGGGGGGGGAAPMPNFGAPTQPSGGYGGTTPYSGGAGSITPPPGSSGYANPPSTSNGGGRTISGGGQPGIR
ncbi:MAG: hypothetical protein KIT00_10325 [Rhodospirillales bacterium]|nr:hypothetical protein [Rhodospirillales bacterium]